MLGIVECGAECSPEALFLGEDSYDLSPRVLGGIQLAALVLPHAGSSSPTFRP